MLKKRFRLSYFVLIICVLNFLFFNIPLLNFVYQNIAFNSASSFTLFISFSVLLILANFFVFFLVFYLSQVVGKVLLSIFFLINSIAIYFVNTYQAILDESMIGNVLNTNYGESSSFFSFKLIFYLLFLGVLPVIFFWKAKIEKTSFKQFITLISLNLLLILGIVFLNASNVLWIDKHAKVLGGLAMPWSYTVNLARYTIHQKQENKKEILLPNVNVTNPEKSLVVLVIGESARSQNFSLYGYGKETNPLLSKMKDVYHFNAKSCETYTTATLKCILEHEKTGDLYEILPNYLFRNDVEVIWRTSNWGEPPVRIPNYHRIDDLNKDCIGEGCGFDEILLKGLSEEIAKSTKNKILVVLHTSTSHGPQYNTKYPKNFEVFSPVCTSVELSNCTNEALVNAYDNTIVYTDYLLHNVIDSLKQLKDFNSTMIYVSDHGESLGEKNLYMHGVPMSLAPKEQYEIPFIVWMSDSTRKLKSNDMLSQGHVFHSVLHSLGLSSPIYNETLNIFE